MATLVGTAVNFQDGTEEQRAARNAASRRSRELRRYGGLPFAEWVKTLDLPPNKLREKIRHRYDHAKNGQRSTTLTYAEWLEENGIELPPPEPAARKAPAPHRDAGLYINIRAAAKEAEWIPWLLLIAAKRLPINPEEVALWS